MPEFWITGLGCVADFRWLCALGSGGSGSLLFVLYVFLVAARRTVSTGKMSRST